MIKLKIAFKPKREALFPILVLKATYIPTKYHCMPILPIFVHETIHQFSGRMDYFLYNHRTTRLSMTLTECDQSKFFWCSDPHFKGMFLRHHTIEYYCFLRDHREYTTRHLSLMVIVCLSLLQWTGVQTLAFFLKRVHESGDTWKKWFLALLMRQHVRVRQYTDDRKNESHYTEGR